MKSRSRRMRITLEENVVRWLRTEAAKINTSVSNFLSGVLKQRMKEAANYEVAKRRALARKPFLKSERPYLTREEAHDRSI
jgi:hypothetical protein